MYVANRIQDGVRAAGKRPVQWWPGLCLGVSTGNRSCGVPDGFCPCRFGFWFEQGLGFRVLWIWSHECDAGAL